MSPGVVLVWIVMGVICGLIGQAIGKKKGRGSDGFWLGLILGVIGLVCVALMKPSERALVAQRAEQMRIDDLARQQLAWQPQEQSPGPVAAYRQVLRESREEQP